VSSAVRLVLAAALAAAAVLAILLARDVRSWRSAFDNGDAAFASQPVQASWSPSTDLGGLAESLLGVGDQTRLRRALRLYRLSARMPARLDNAELRATARTRAQTALTAAARDSNGTRASQALTLLGILAFGATGQGVDQSQVEAAAADFTDAIRADPDAEDPKFDLELLLRSTAAHGVRIGPGLGGASGKTGRRGAGGGLPGRGY
jgi:hypothetical protein